MLEDKRPGVVGVQLEGPLNRKADGSFVDLFLVSCGKMHALAKAGVVSWYSLVELRREDVS